jgi:hypothetical protein
MDDEATAEDRLHKFCNAMETNDMAAIPASYMTNDDPTPFIVDMREVLKRLAQAESTYRAV